MTKRKPRTDNLHKRCKCPIRIQAKCKHPWYFSYTHKGKQYRLSLDRHVGHHIENRTDAETEAAKLKIAIKDGTFGAKPEPPPPVPDTLETYARSWLRTAEGRLKVSSVHFYTDHLENHIVPALGSRPISAITKKDCRELVATVREKGLSINTVRGIVRTLSAVLSQAEDDELLPQNPALRMGKYLRRGDEPKPKIDPFTRDEVEHLDEVALEHFPDWHAWMLTGLRTGLRAGELLGLQWGDVDWRGRYVLVQRSYSKGRLTTPKSGKERKVDLSPRLRAVLRLWRWQQTRKWGEHGLPRAEWIFPSDAGTPLDDSNVRKMFNRILDKAELHRRGPHQMRHTFGSLLLMAGAAITYVSQQMGHADSSITLRVYAHYIPSAGVEKGVDRLDFQENLAQTLHKRRRETVG